MENNEGYWEGLLKHLEQREEMRRDSEIEEHKREQYHQAIGMYEGTLGNKEMEHPFSNY
jgi:hypothetical protein